MARTYENSVFINCPFDNEYLPLFTAILFSVYECGFHPRCALEVEDGSQVRIEKINTIISQCRLAVHDISRTEPDRGTLLPRFNMPLELGIFLGAKTFGDPDQNRKAAMILDVDQYRYHRYVSDIAGQDIRAHAGEPHTAIRQVRNFLASHSPPEVHLYGGDGVVERYEQFSRELPGACAHLRLDPKDLTFTDLNRFIVGWLKS